MVVVRKIPFIGQITVFQYVVANDRAYYGRGEHEVHSGQLRMTIRRRAWRESGGLEKKRKDDAFAATKLTRDGQRGETRTNTTSATTM